MASCAAMHRTLHIILPPHLKHACKNACLQAVCHMHACTLHMFQIRAVCKHGRAHQLQRREPQQKQSGTSSASSSLSLGGCSRLIWRSPARFFALGSRWSVGRFDIPPCCCYSCSRVSVLHTAPLPPAAVLGSCSLLARSSSPTCVQPCVSKVHLRGDACSGGWCWRPGAIEDASRRESDAVRGVS